MLLAYIWCDTRVGWYAPEGNRAKSKREKQEEKAGQKLGYTLERLCNYRRRMVLLGAPFVFQCAWRSFFPEVYNTRVVFWDTWLCNAFIGRALATIGEVTWTAQVVSGLIWCTEELESYYAKFA